MNLNKFNFSLNEKEVMREVYSLLFSVNKRNCTAQFTTEFSCILNLEERDLKILSLDAIENEIDHRSSR